MRKIAKIAVVTNLLLALLFAYSSFSLWGLVDAEYPYLIASYWGPIGVSAPHYAVNSEGHIAVVQAIFWYYNFPFWIFFVALAVNLYFFYKLSKNDRIIRN